MKSIKKLLLPQSSVAQRHNEEIRSQQEKVNREIEKQLKKDKRRLLYTHRLQLVGLPNAGKSTLIKQIRILNGEYEVASIRAAAAADIRQVVLRSITDFLQRWSEIKIVVSPADESEEIHEILDQTVADGLAALEKPEVLFSVAANLWQHSSFRQVWRSEAISDIRLRNAEHFMNKLKDIKDSDYSPSHEDILSLYTETLSGIQETAFKLEEITFVLLEFHGSRRIIMDNDVMAFIFLVDLSEYDMILNQESGKYMYVNRLA